MNDLGRSDLLASVSDEFVLFDLADPRSFELDQRPLLASWDAKDSPAQLRLRRYLDHIDAAVDHRDASGIHLVVHDDGAQSGQQGRDLDNYLLPVARRLGPTRLDLARASKTAAPGNRLIVGRTRARADLHHGWRFASATTDVSAETRTWKESVHAQVARAAKGHGGAGPLQMEIGFRVGPERTWSNLWKPAIDALGPILGEGRLPFAPRDDLITELGLHRQVVPDLHHRVELGIWWRPATPANL